MLMSTHAPDDTAARDDAIAAAVRDANWPRRPSAIDLDVARDFRRTPAAARRFGLVLTRAGSLFCCTPLEAHAGDVGAWMVRTGDTLRYVVGHEPARFYLWTRRDGLRPVEGAALYRALLDAAAAEPCVTDVPTTLMRRLSA